MLVKPPPISLLASIPCQKHTNIINVVSRIIILLLIIYLFMHFVSFCTLWLFSVCLLFYSTLTNTCCRFYCLLPSSFCSECAFEFIIFFFFALIFMFSLFSCALEMKMSHIDFKIHTLSCVVVTADYLLASHTMERENVPCYAWQCRQLF